jgi:hypothetical protein
VQVKVATSEGLHSFILNRPSAVPAAANLISSMKYITTAVYALVDNGACAGIATGTEKVANTGSDSVTEVGTNGVICVKNVATIRYPSRMCLFLVAICRPLPLPEVQMVVRHSQQPIQNYD